MLDAFTFELVEEPCEELTLSENAVTDYFDLAPRFVTFSLPSWWESSAPVDAQEGQEDPDND